MNQHFRNTELPWEVTHFFLTVCCCMYADCLPSLDLDGGHDIFFVFDVLPMLYVYGLVVCSHFFFGSMCFLLFLSFVANCFPSFAYCIPTTFCTCCKHSATIMQTIIVIQIEQQKKIPLQLGSQERPAFKWKRIRRKVSGHWWHHEENCALKFTYGPHTQLPFLRKRACTQHVNK